MGQQATRTLLIIVKNSGIDQTNTALKGMAATTNTAAKGTDALGSSWSKTGAISTKATGSFTKLDSSAKKTTASTNTYGKAVDSAGSKTQGLAQKFQGNRGAIFAFVGMATAGAEAVGMFSMYQDAANKLSDAQERVNTLERLGATDTAAYTRATRDADEAQRGLRFILRNTALSFGDLIPFFLLSINALVKMKTTVDAVKPAMDGVSQSVNTLGQSASTAATGGLTAATTAAQNFGGGLTDLGVGVRNTTTGTNDMYLSTGKLKTGLDDVSLSVRDNTKFLGTKGSGLVGGMSALSVGMDQSTKTSTKFREAFRQIGEHFKSIPSVLSGVGSSIAGFFTNFGANMSKFGGILKTAGVAAMTFSKTMLLAFLSNPITAAIAGISAAVLALATDFLGVRTAINNFGVAVGDAIPQLKGILGAIGGVANGALDAVANLLGMEKGTDDAGEAALRATPKYVQLTTAIKDSQTLGPIFDTLRKQVAGLTQETEAYSSKSIIGYKQVYTAADAALTPQQKQIPEVSAVLKELAGATTEAAVKGKTLAEVKANLNVILTKLQTALIGGATKQNAYNVSTMKGAETTEKHAEASTHASEATINLATSMALAEADGKGVGSMLTENQEIMQKWLNSIGIGTINVETLSAADEAFISGLTEIAPALTEIGHLIERNAQGGIDYAKTLQNMVLEQDNLGASADALWTDMETLIKNKGVEGLKLVEQAVRLLELAHSPLAETTRDTFEKYKEQLKSSGQYVQYLTQDEDKRESKRKTYAEKEKQDLEETADELGYKAEQYGVLLDAENQSIQTQETIIEYYDDEKKAGEDLISTLQTMALKRGMAAEELTENTPALLKWIETHHLEKIATDEIIQVVAKKIDAYSQERRELGLQEAAAMHLLSTMKESIHVTGMSGEGLMKYIDIIQEAKEANETAADSVGLWYAELGKSQLVEEATREKLEEFAEMHHVKIPKSIRDGSLAAFQEYVDEVMNIALKTDEAMQMIQDAVDQGVSQLSGSFNKISSDAGKAFSEGTKEFKKFLKETGLDPDNPLVLQGIVDMVMNDVNFEDDFTGFTENLASRLGDLKGATKGEITSMVKEWNTTISSEMKDNPEALAAIQDQSDKIISTMNTILNSGQGVKPIEAFIAAIGEVLGKDDAVKMAEQLGIKIPPALAAKLKAGKGAITSGTKEGIYDPLAKELEGATSLVGKEGDSAIAMYGESLENGKTKVQNAVLAGAIDPVTGEIQALPPEIKKGLEPVEGVFSEAFLKASAGATGQLNTMITTLHNSMSFLQKGIAMRLTEITGSWNDHATNVGTATANIGVKVQALQTILSSFSTSVATYMGSMKDNILIFTEDAQLNFQTLNDFIFNTLQLTFSNLSNNILTYVTSMGENIRLFSENAVIELTKLNDYVFATLQLTWSNLSSNILTYTTSMGTNISEFVTNSVAELAKLDDQVFNKTQKAFSNLSTSVATYMKSMTANIAKFGKDATKAFTDLESGGIKKAHTAFSNMSTSVATYSKSMTTNISGFVKTSITQLAGLSATALGVGKNFGTMASQTKSAMSAAGSAIKSFSSQAVSALKKVESAANSATKALNAMASAAKKAKSAASGLRYGGMLITGGAMDMGSAHAQQGKSWINTRPRKIAGVNISEFGKPELVQVTPLSNPSDPMDRAINYAKVPGSNMENIPKSTGKVNTNIGVGGAGGIGKGQKVSVTGNAYFTIRTQSGKVLAEEIQPFMLEGYSNITS